ncbi:MAG TPA: nuclear transport factor 2 family protein [Solirubrobacteraceae bacterium]
MSDINAVIEKFVASWNEPDAAARRGVIDDVWSTDGVYRNARTEYPGREGIAQAVTEAYNAFGANGFVFRLASVDTNHDAVRYRWEMVPAAGGEPNSIGTHVAMVGGDGRIVTDHQFIDKPPSGS